MVVLIVGTLVVTTETVVLIVGTVVVPMGTVGLIVGAVVVTMGTVGLIVGAVVVTMGTVVLTIGAVVVTRIVLEVGAELAGAAATEERTEGRAWLLCGARVRSSAVELWRVFTSAPVERARERQWTLRS